MTPDAMRLHCQERLWLGDPIDVPVNGNFDAVRYGVVVYEQVKSDLCASGLAINFELHSERSSCQLAARTLTLSSESTMLRMPRVTRAFFMSTFCTRIRILRIQRKRRTGKEEAYLPRLCDEEMLDI